MLVSAFFSWWYGAGWRQVINSWQPRLQSINESFSVSLLLKTLFAPWRRIITYPGASLAEKWRAWGDNLFSRCIGFIIRLFVLLAAGLSVIIIGLLTVLEIVLWPLLPLAVPGCLVAGLVL